MTAYTELFGKSYRKIVNVNIALNDTRQNI